MVDMAIVSRYKETKDPISIYKNIYKIRNMHTDTRIGISAV